MTVTGRPNTRPLVLVGHPRSRSSAFERVFIQNEAHVNCLHEPFGDAYWLGPERQGGRYEELRDDSGYSNATYKTAMDTITECSRISAVEGKRLFIKEMAFFLFPPARMKSHIASSFGVLPEEPRNPTLLPRAELAKFDFTFVIRHPYQSVPSYYRLSLSGEKETSMVKELTTDDLGYSELRRLFDYLLEEGLVRKPTRGASRSAANGPNDICVVDSEDLMDNPDRVMSAYCKIQGIPYDESILHWNNPEDQKRAAAVINKWGFPVTFHKAVLNSTGLGIQKNLDDAKQIYQKWIEEFGIDGAEKVKRAADSQMNDYNYLKKFVSMSY